MNKSLVLSVSALFASPMAWAESTQMTGLGESSTLFFEHASQWKVSVGGGIASVPRYEGSASNRLRFVPLLDVENGHLFAGTTRGIGYNFSDNKDLQYGVRMTLAHNRKQSADVHLNGMGNIGYAAEAGAFVNARFAPWYVSSGLAASSHGAWFELGGGYEAQLVEADRLRIGANLTWANAKYNQTYFGVTAAQAAASGNVLTAYTASSGVKDYGIAANWMHSYSKEWFSNAGVSFKQLSGSDKNSPLTVKSGMNSVNFVVGYRF